MNVKSLTGIGGRSLTGKNWGCDGKKGVGWGGSYKFGVPSERKISGQKSNGLVKNFIGLLRFQIWSP